MEINPLFREKRVCFGRTCALYLCFQWIRSLTRASLVSMPYSRNRILGYASDSAYLELLFVRQHLLDVVEGDVLRSSPGQFLHLFA